MYESEYRRRNTVSSPLQMKADDFGDVRKAKRQNPYEGTPIEVSGRLASRIKDSFGIDPGELKLRESPEVSEMGMRAAAQGDTIRFAPGEFKPDTTEGLKTLGHELNHVREQASGNVHAPGGEIFQHPSHEAASDKAGEAFASGSLSDSAPVNVGGMNTNAAPVQGKHEDDEGTGGDIAQMQDQFEPDDEQEVGIPTSDEFLEAAQIKGSFFKVKFGDTKRYNQLISQIAKLLRVLNQNGDMNSREAYSSAVEILTLLDAATANPKCTEQGREYLNKVRTAVMPVTLTNTSYLMPEKIDATLFPTGDSFHQTVSRALSGEKAPAVVARVADQLDIINLVLKFYTFPNAASVSSMTQKQDLALKLAGAIGKAHEASSAIKKAVYGYAKPGKSNIKVVNLLTNLIPTCDEGIAALRNIYDIAMRYYSGAETPVEIIFEGKTLNELSTKILMSETAYKSGAEKSGGAVNEVSFIKDTPWGSSVVKPTSDVGIVIKEGKEEKQYGMAGEAINQSNARFNDKNGDDNLGTKTSKLDTKTSEPDVEISRTMTTTKHNLSTRDVSVGRVSNLFGFDSIVGTRQTRSFTGEHKDITMDAAKGKMAANIDFYMGGEQDGGDIPKEAKLTAVLKRLIYGVGKAAKVDGPREKNIASAIADLGEVSYQNVFESDLISLMRMKIIDAVCAHTDRHSENFFFDPVTKKFTGIDNDLSFTYETDVNARATEYARFGLKNDVPCIDEETKKAVLNVSEDSLRAVLADALPPVFVEAAVSRLKSVKEHISNVQVLPPEEIAQFIRKKTNALIESDENIAKKVSTKEDKDGAINRFNMRLGGVKSFKGASNIAEGLTAARVADPLAAAGINLSSYFSPEFVEKENLIAAKKDLGIDDSNIDMYYRPLPIVSIMAEMLLNNTGWDVAKALDVLKDKGYRLDEAAGYKVPTKATETEKTSA